jgi:hypothetical protein
MIVADTGAILALLDADDRHHEALRRLYQADPARWIVPWAVLPEVDYLVRRYLGVEVERTLLDNLAGGTLVIEWGEGRDLVRARDLTQHYRDLELGLVDAVVMAVAERLGAAAIATLDLRDFGSVALRGNPRLLPRDS